MTTKITAKHYRQRADAILSGMSADERYTANRTFYAIAGRVWTPREIGLIQFHADDKGATFLKATEWVATAVAIDSVTDEESDVSPQHSRTGDPR